MSRRTGSDTTPAGVCGNYPLVSAGERDMDAAATPAAEAPQPQ